MRFIKENIEDNIDSITNEILEEVARFIDNLDKIFLKYEDISLLENLNRKL